MKEKYIRTLLHPSKCINTPPNKKSYTNFPPKYKTALIPKLLPLFITNDKGQVIERSSSHLH